MSKEPPRNRKIYAGLNTAQLLDDYFPADTVEVSGESFYFEALSNVARFLQIGANKFHQVDAFLRVEPENLFDEKAVAVFIHEQKVGYVNKDEAPEIFDGLQPIGGEAWVLAAIKEIEELHQYRVRLMISKPVRLDYRAFPLLDLTDIQAPELNGDPVILSLELEALLYNIPETVSLEELGLTDPVCELVLFTIAVNFLGETEIVGRFREVEISRVAAKDHPELFEAISEANNAAWTAVFFHDEGTSGDELNRWMLQFLKPQLVLQKDFPQL